MGDQICKGVILILTSISFLLCCGEDVESLSSSRDDFAAITIQRNQNSNAHNIKDAQLEVERVILKPDLANQIGSISHFFQLENQLILVDKNSERIVSVSPQGSLIWQLKGQSDDYASFSTIQYCTFDKYNNQLLVLDDRQTVYVYSPQGKFLETKRRPRFNFNIFAALSKDVMVYSAQNLNNNMLDGQSKQLLMVEKGKVVTQHVNHVLQLPRRPNMGGFPEFFIQDTSLFYKAALRDTVYEMSTNTKPSPTFVIKFDVRESTDEVLRNPARTEKLSYIINRNIPFIYSLTSNGEYLYISYRDSESRSLAKIDAFTGETIFNAGYLQYGDWLFKTPLLEFNGVFLAASTVAEDKANRRYLQNQSDENFTVWQRELNELEKSGMDNGAMVLYLLKT